jgi:imidazolonepropionase-like amidohydrolase
MTTWILIKDGNVIDGTGTPAQVGTSVLIRGNRIVEVGDTATIDKVPSGDDLTIIDAHGKTVMPGLIDCHCHMTYGESRTQEEIDLYTSVEARTLRAAFNSKKVLRAGVTSISQPGGSYYIGVALRDAVKIGMVEGPRSISAGRYLTTSNGLTDYYPDPVGLPESSIGVLTNTVAEMLTEIRKQVKAGVDIIKLADSPFGEYQAFTNDELKHVTELAHNLKRKVTIHARGSAEVGASVDAGVDWIMHGNVMTDEVIDKLARSKIPLVPTLLLLANFSEWGDRVGVPAAVSDGCSRMLEKTADTLHRAHKAGVTLLAGSDSGFSVTPYGEWHAREMELLMQYSGMSSLEAIRSMTSAAAPLVRMEGQIGVVAPGMLADVLVVGGDPVKDIRVLQDRKLLETVIQDGRVVEFDDEMELVRWPHERVIMYSHGDLTYDLIYRTGETAKLGDRLQWTQSDGKLLAAEIKTVEGNARIAGVVEE